ncbi:hypothetical protein [Marinilabilia salmonicolor]|uniref:GLPGLI family protein n=1 Tax=Marinilabilia salmonicolor TaxID=989 RepID=A0A368VI12_9BACT|nr:hypothetical protein [Marinilabilia salmonicolor]RCW38641.1 GLPGLI family protein [Marinilabilia salmonicolor]
MKQRPRFILESLSLCALFVFLIIAGCKQQPKQKTPVVSQGVVNYSISYSPEIKAKSYSFLLPEEMQYFFRTGQERISFAGYLGIYTLDFISNHQTDSSATLLKIINKKMYVPASESNELFIFQQLKEGKVVFEKDTTRNILGYRAQKAIIKLPKENNEIIVWYTPEIATPTTNKNTPFAKIPGVMLEYAIYFNDVLFTLTPISVIGDTLPESIFEVPGDYQTSTIQEIEQTISTIIKK